MVCQGRVLVCQGRLLVSCMRLLVLLVVLLAEVYCKHLEPFILQLHYEHYHRHVCNVLTGNPDKPNLCLTHASYEATLQQGRKFVHNALFQAGGVNYSGKQS